MYEKIYMKKKTHFINDFSSRREKYINIYIYRLYTAHQLRNHSSIHHFIYGKICFLRWIRVENLSKLQYLLFHYDAIFLCYDSSIGVSSRWIIRIKVWKKQKKYKKLKIINFIGKTCIVKKFIYDRKFIYNVYRFIYIYQIEYLIEKHCLIQLQSSV